jgi:hypothetical protein
MRFGRRPDAMPVHQQPHPPHPLERAMPAEGLTTLGAIKRRCIDCSGGTAAGAKGCTHAGCGLWPFRMGHNPNRAGLGRKDGLFAGKSPAHGPAGQDAPKIRATVKAPPHGAERPA